MYIFYTRNGEVCEEGIWLHYIVEQHDMCVCRDDKKLDVGMSMDKFLRQKLCLFGGKLKSFAETL